MHTPVNRVFNNVSRNLGLNEYTEHIDTWAEWAFEAEQYIGSLDTFLETEITYQLDTPVAATAEIKFANNPVDKEFIEIGGTRFYFRDLTSAAVVIDDEYIIQIAATLDLTMANVVSKISTSFFQNIKGVSAVWDSATTILTLTYARTGDEGNHVSLNTSGQAEITKFFTGGKERIHNKQVRLQDNMVKLISVRQVGRIIFHTSAQFKSKVSSESNRYYVNGNRLNFTNISNTADLVITYLSVPMSEEGYPMIKQGHEEAVATYIMWKFKLIDYYSAKAPQYIVKDLEKRWYWLCSQTRGNDNMPNSSELLKIGKVFNSKTRPRLYDGLTRY